MPSIELMEMWYTVWRRAFNKVGGIIYHLPVPSMALDMWQQGQRYEAYQMLRQWEQEQQYNTGR